MNDADFIVRDTTDSITNFLWRDHSSSKLYLGTADAQPTTRYDLYTQGGSKYFHAGNDGAGSGLDADTVDGVHASGFATSTHDHTILKTSGNYQWSNSTTAGSYPTVNGSPGVQTSFVRGADGWPSYGAVLHVGARGGGDAGGDFQLFCGHGSQNGGNYLRVRNADNSASPSDSWTSWRTIWDSGNDGSGSGLDADTVDGIQGSSFLRSDADDTMNGKLTINYSTHYKGIHLNGNNAPCITFVKGVTSTPTWRAGISGYDGAAFAISTGASVGDRLHIKNSGDVGIGTTSPTERLHVSGNILLTGNLVGSSTTTEIGQFGSNSVGAIKRIRMTQGGELHFGDTSTSNFFGITEGTVNQFSDTDRLGIYYRNELKLYSNTNTLRVTFDVSGNVTATGNITANSDISLKDNITPIPNALDKVLQIRGVTFNRNDIEDNPRHAGVIAQEVEKVLPEVVSEGEDGIKSVAYGNMVSLLIEAIKEQQEQIDMLKEKLESK